MSNKSLSPPKVSYSLFTDDIDGSKPLVLGRFDKGNSLFTHDIKGAQPRDFKYLDRGKKKQNFYPDARASEQTYYGMNFKDPGQRPGRRHFGAHENTNLSDARPHLFRD